VTSLFTRYRTYHWTRFHATSTKNWSHHESPKSYNMRTNFV